MKTILNKQMGRQSRTTIMGGKQKGYRRAYLIEVVIRTESYTT